MKKALRYLSPCILAVIFCLLAIITGYAKMESSGGWSYLAVIIFLPVLITAVIIDIIVKLIFKEKILYIWLVEIVLLVVAYYLFIGKYV